MPVNFKNIPHEGIQTLIPYKPGKSIEELAREKGLSDIIKLASNENPLGCSPKALTAIHNCSPHLVATYPSPINHYLMDKLATHLNIDKKQLFLSNGSDYIYTLLLECFALYQGKHIVTHDQAFSTYTIQAKTLNIPVISVPVLADWQVNVDALIAACNEDTALVFIANPNNPTGRFIAQSEVKRLLNALPKQCILVLDEAYFEYAQAEYSENSIDWLKEHRNLVITRTFSKIYGLAGARIGYGIADPEIIELLLRIQLPFTVNQIAMIAASAALEDDDFIAQSLELNRKGFMQMQKGLQQLDISYIPSSCNFITFDSKANGNILFEYLLNKGIIIRPLHAYQMDRYLRVTVGTAEQNNRFLEALYYFYQA